MCNVLYLLFAVRWGSKRILGPNYLLEETICLLSENYVPCYVEGTEYVKSDRVLEIFNITKKMQYFSLKNYLLSGNISHYFHLGVLAKMCLGQYHLQNLKKCVSVL